MVFSKKKEFALKKSKFFPLREDPFLEGVWRTEKQSGSHKSSPLSKMAKQQKQ